MPILCESAASAASAANIAAAIPGEVRVTDTLQATAAVLEQDLAEKLLVIGPTVPLSDALTFASALRPVRPATGVILIRNQVDVPLLTLALRAGIREVVPVGDAVALESACRRSYDISAELAGQVPEATRRPERRGRLVTVFAAKGGCGKTTFAINLAAALAADPSLRVCVVDLDLAFGDVAISVQLDPSRTITDAVPMTGHLDDTGAASLLTSYRPNLEMLLAPVTPGDAEKVPPDLVGELLGVLRSLFDYIVVDTPAQFSEHVLTAMDASEHHVLLTTPDVPALKNLRITLDMLDLLSYSRQSRSVVLNRSDAKVGLTMDDVQHVVRCPIVAHIPSSRDVPISINKGVPIVVASPNHPVSVAIASFARQRLGPVPAEAPAGKRDRGIRSARGERTRGRRRTA